MLRQLILLGTLPAALAIEPAQSASCPQIWSGDSAARSQPAATIKDATLQKLMRRLLTDQEIELLSGALRGCATYKIFKGDIEKCVEYIRTKDSQLPESPDQQLALLIPFWRPHLVQVLRSAGLDNVGVTQLLAAVRRSPELSSRLVAPKLQTGLQSHGFDRFYVSMELISDYLREHVQLTHWSGGPRRLKIVLGGTLADEVRWVVEETEIALRESASRIGITDVDAWIGGWDIQIVGYSIASHYLLEMKRELQESLPAERARWVRLEYLDLLDAFELERLKAERPDIVFTVNSLYLQEHFDIVLPALSPQRGDHPEKASRRTKYQELTRRLIRYIGWVHDALPSVGLFVTERAPRNGAPMQPFLRVSKRDPKQRERSGIHFKGSDLDVPFSFLGGVENTRRERELHAAYRAYLEGRTEDAAIRIYSVLRSHALMPNQAAPLRFPLVGALAIVREALEGGGIAAGSPAAVGLTRLQEILAQAHASRQAGQDIDLLPSLRALPRIDRADTRP